MSKNVTYIPVSLMAEFAKNDQTVTTKTDSGIETTRILTKSEFCTLHGCGKGKKGKKAYNAYLREDGAKHNEEMIKALQEKKLFVRSFSNHAERSIARATFVKANTIIDPVLKLSKAAKAAEAAETEAKRMVEKKDKQIAELQAQLAKLKKAA